MGTSDNNRMETILHCTKILPYWIVAIKLQKNGNIARDTKRRDIPVEYSIQRIFGDFVARSTLFIIVYSLQQNSLKCLSIHKKKKVIAQLFLEQKKRWYNALKMLF